MASFTHLNLQDQLRNRAIAFGYAFENVVNVGASRRAG